jgi:hypothetical protein
LQKILSDHQMASSSATWQDDLRRDFETITEHSALLDLRSKTSLASLEMIMQVLPTLRVPFQTIDLRDNHLGNQCCPLLLRLMSMPHIERLMLEGNDINDRGKRVLMAHLARHPSCASVNILTPDDLEFVRLYQ